MLSVVVNVEGVLRTLETSALLASDLEKPLAMFGGYLRNRALARYEAQGFQPLAEATLQARARKGLGQLEGKLQRDLDKATERARGMRSPRGLLAQLLEAPGMTDAIVGETKGVRNRRAVLAEFQRLHVKRASKLRQQSGFQRQVGARPLSIKQHVSLVKRIQRAVAKAMDAPILGKLPRTLVVLADGDTMQMVSATHAEFTDVHNEGGEAGHGAREPKRETVVLETHDLDVLVAILEHHALAPFEKG